jgi:hypothetical protein
VVGTKVNKRNNQLCPLSSAEQRVSDCLSLWLETKANYFDPNAFRLSLNNCIQTERNVTWVLQKTKKQFANFDSWYDTWQKKMQEDKIMKWLTIARNIVVKEGDLSTLSKLRIEVVETWFASPYFEMAIPPLTDTEEFAKILAKNAPDNIDFKVGLLRVERLWIDEQLKECELLEALSHAFILLFDLVIDAHEHLSFDKELKKCHWYAYQNTNKDEYVSHTKAQEWDRTIWLDLKTGQRLRPLERPIERIDDEDVKKHYPTLMQISSVKEITNLNQEAIFLFNAAKEILITDGFHLPTAILGYPNGHKEVVGLEIFNRTEKHLAIRKLAADIEKAGATSVVLINEVWVSKTDNYQLTPTGVDSPTLREALLVIAVNEKGEIYTRRVFFTKNKDGKVILGKEVNPSHEIINLIAPIQEVWRKRNYKRTGS